MASNCAAVSLLGADGRNDAIGIEVCQRSFAAGVSQDTRRSVLRGRSGQTGRSSRLRSRSLREGRGNKNNR